MIEQLAKRLYGRYCQAVGWESFDGGPLPSWEDFASSPRSQKQAAAWRAVAEEAVLAVNPSQSPSPDDA